MFLVGRSGPGDIQLDLAEVFDQPGQGIGFEDLGHLGGRYRPVYLDTRRVPDGAREILKVDSDVQRTSATHTARRVGEAPSYVTPEQVGGRQLQVGGEVTYGDSAWIIERVVAVRGPVLDRDVERERFGDESDTDLTRYVARKVAESPYERRSAELLRRAVRETDGSLAVDPIVEQFSSGLDVELGQGAER